MKFGLMLVMAGLLASPALAQTPSAPLTGRVPSGTAPVPPNTPQELAAKAVINNWAALMSAGKVAQAFDEYVDPNFVEHSDVMRFFMKVKEVKRDAFEAFMAKDWAKGLPGGGKGGNGLKFNQVLVANDDIVIQYGALGADIFRVENGKIVEHWDASPPTAEMTYLFK